MKRYIDAEDLKDRLQSLAYDDWNQGVSTTWANAYSEVADMIDDFPSADVREVKRGRWIKYEDRYCWYCSECNEDNYYAYCWNSDTGMHELQDKFCPSCGAEMEKS